MRLATIVLAIGVPACAAPARVAPEMIVPEPPRPAAAGAAPAPSSEHDAGSPPSSFLLRTASSRYDFRFDMKGTCPGLALYTPGCAGPAVLHVTTKDGAELQKIDLDEVWINFDGAGAPLVNTAELYDTQGTVIVGDFDFDGREDFAVQVDHTGPYGGPTSAVFLHAAGEERFVRSEPLSQLTRESLGFFRVDVARKRLITFQKSGCCYHVTEWHDPTHGALRVVERITEDATVDPAFVVRTEERLVSGRWRKRVHRVPAAP